MFSSVKKILLVGGYDITFYSALNTQFTWQHTHCHFMCVTEGCRYRYQFVSYLKLVIGQDLSLVKLKFLRVERVLIVWLKVRWKELMLRLPRPKKPLYSLCGRLKHLRRETRHLGWQHVRSVIGNCSTGGGNPGDLCRHTETFKLWLYFGSQYKVKWLEQP